MVKEKRRRYEPHARDKLQDMSQEVTAPFQNEIGCQEREKRALSHVDSFLLFQNSSAATKLETMSSRQSPVARKPVAIKHVDGQPLSRRDLQYDVLHHIFTDTHQVFTDPTYGGTPARKVCFRDLYVNAIMHSPKSSKMSRDKMTDVPNFATDFAMLSMLANVGRVNTTMSCMSHMLSSAC